MFELSQRNPNELFNQLPEVDSKLLQYSHVALAELLETDPERMRGFLESYPDRIAGLRQYLVTKWVRTDLSGATDYLTILAYQGDTPAIDWGRMTLPVVSEIQDPSEAFQWLQSIRHETDADLADSYSEVLGRLIHQRSADIVVMLRSMKSGIVRARLVRQYVESHDSDLNSALAVLSQFEGEPEYERLLPNVLAQNVTADNIEGVLSGLETGQRDSVLFNLVIGLNREPDAAMSYLPRIMSIELRDRAAIRLALQLKRSDPISFQVLIDQHISSKGLEVMAYLGLPE